MTLQSSTPEPEWNEAGEPTTLAAAAEDAHEWLVLIQKLNARGVWKFSEPDSLQKLHRCRESLRKHIKEGA